MFSLHGAVSRQKMGKPTYTAARDKGFCSPKEKHSALSAFGCTSHAKANKTDEMTMKQQAG